MKLSITRFTRWLVIMLATVSGAALLVTGTVLAAPQPAVPSLPLKTLTPLGNSKQVAAGSSHTCALTNAGGVLCWGKNSYGELGDGTEEDKLSPVAVIGLRSGVQAIAAGASHTCALTTGGAVLCWGDNEFGGLGDGTMDYRVTPVAVTGLSSGIQAITAGSGHTCALTVGGAVLCWGWNDVGQLGDGTTVDKLTPTAVVGLNSGVQAISAGGVYTCALTTSGGVLCWGANVFGTLGDGTTVDKQTPVAVVSLTSGVQVIATGSSHACALTMAGGLFCWGFNFDGQVGDGTSGWQGQKNIPVAVTALSNNVQGITAGRSHTCALTTGSSVLCWGRNDFGQLANGTTVNQLTPTVTIGLNSDIQMLDAGGDHTCTLTSTDSLLCWGRNSNGQLGNGSTDDATTPVPVVIDPCVISCTKQLAIQSGWNLIAIPIVPTTTTTAAVFGSFIGKYDLAYAYDGCAAGNPWQKYNPSGPPFANTLTTVTGTQGLWVRATSTATLSVTGSDLANISIPLCAGWNLIGWPGNAPTPIATALAGIAGKYDLVYAYDAGSPVNPWKKYNPTGPPFANTLTELKPGMGYWLRATQATMLVVE